MSLKFLLKATVKTILDNKFNDSGCKSENNEITYTRVRPLGILTIIYHSNWIPKSTNYQITLFFMPGRKRISERSTIHSVTIPQE